MAHPRFPRTGRFMPQGPDGFRAGTPKRALYAGMTAQQRLARMTALEDTAGRAFCVPGRARGTGVEHCPFVRQFEGITLEGRGHSR